MITACRGLDGGAVTVFEADHDLRRFAGRSTPAYVPDAIVEIAVDTECLGFVFEVDTGTEGAAYFARGKATAVLALQRARAACWGLAAPWQAVVVAPTARRLQSLASEVAKIGGAEAWLAGTLDTLACADILEARFALLPEILAFASATKVAFTHPLLDAARAWRNGVTQRVRQVNP